MINTLESGQPLPDLSSRIPPRRAEWQRWLKVTPPAILPEKSGWSVLIPWHRASDDRSTLHGTGTSTGQVTAPACVLIGPEDFPRMRPGDVLVAVTTTPAWTPLFAMASAVVTDIGGPLSHSSIVAREYGIPAVMGTGAATRQILSGQTITVDGDTGMITLHASAAKTDGRLEWKTPAPKIVLTRSSFAEFLPDPVSPLFGTLATPIAAKATMVLMNQLAGVDDPDCYLMTTINGYFYVGMKMTFKVLWQLFFQNVLAMKKIFGSAKDRWEVAGEKYQAMVRNWQEREVTTLTGQELLAGVREIFELTAEYYTVIQSGTIGISSTSEILFGKLYELAGEAQGRGGRACFPIRVRKQGLASRKIPF